MWPFRRRRRIGSVGILTSDGRGADPPMVDLEGLEPVVDPAPAAWIAERLLPHERTLTRAGNVIPQGFEAYARVFHPGSRRVAGAEWRSLRWAEVAAENGKQLHHEMQWNRIRETRGADEHLPREGRMDVTELAALASTLERFTGAPDRTWFALWEGDGSLDLLRDAPPPSLMLPGRRYLLYRGDLRAINVFDQHPVHLCPNIWWPDDRAWCVATEIDFAWTYVGGTDACIDAVLASPDLEALRTGVDARADSQGDRLN